MSRLLWQCKLAVAADRVDDAAAHYRALAALDAESPASMEVLASLASAYGRRREQGAEVSSACSAGSSVALAPGGQIAAAAHVARACLHPSRPGRLQAILQPPRAWTNTASHCL